MRAVAQCRIEHRALSTVIPFLSPSDPFPPVEAALQAPNGLLAAGGDLSPERLLAAYAEGIFPWFGEDDPILWWSPDPRMVLYAREVHVARSLHKVLKAGKFRVTLDAAFPAVVRACAEARRDHEGTWITPAMEEAYIQLAELGHAHSVEAWQGETLAGGLYGVAVGRMFFGESMFTRVRDASKVALVRLARQLEAWNMPMIDCQMSTQHLASLGARDIRRTDFVDEVRYLVRQPPVATPWQMDG
jgi:leucyl/phenylalanyl-tRNA--protein transferase